MPEPLDCIVVAGDLPQEFLGTTGREAMRLAVDGTPASLNYLAHYFALGRDAATARVAMERHRRSFIGLNGPWLRQYLTSRGLRAEWIALLSTQREEFAALLARRPRAVVLSTTFLPLAEHIDAMAAAIKQQAPDTLVIAGGTQVWKSWQHRLLRERGGIADDILPAVAAHNYLMDDARPSPVDLLVVSGSGEETLARLLLRLRVGEAWDDLPNLAWQADGRWRINPVKAEANRPVAVDWRDVDLPDAPLYLPVQAGQGCGFRCTFCDFCGLFPRVSHRDPADIVAEIRTMPEQGGVRRVYFTDDNLFANRARARAMCQALIDSELALRWRGMFRVNMVDAGIAALLRRSGCQEVLLGIESGDPEILANMNKQVSPAAALEALSHLNRAGINTKNFFIVGFPGETRASVDRTVDFINAYPTDGPGVHRYTIFTFAPLPLAEVSSAAARTRFGLEGYGFKWRHATMDSDTANAELERMFEGISPALSPSYSLEVPELPGLDAAALKAVYLLRNRLALAARGIGHGDPAALWDELERAFADVDPGRLVAAS